MARIATGSAQLGRGRPWRALDAKQGWEPLPGFVPERIVGIDMGRKLAAIARLLQSRLRCSFCGRAADEVGRLVAGPSVYICDECIKMCVAVVEQHGGFPASRRGDQDGPTHA